jgi:ABC-type bacteriocin/lantibiotic exporter with double-glycine peptidase domain
MAADCIIFDNVSFTYQKESGTLVNSCSFELMKGDKLVIKGESGTGKTTIFRLIHGFEKPDEGKILYEGKELNLETIQQLRKKSAWLPQDLNLGSGRVKEVLSFPFEFSANQSSKPDEEKIKDTFEKLGLEASLLDKDFADLSTGQRQRAGIALSYLLDKPLLLLDEPTSALDRISKQKVIDLLFSDSNKTILSTSHDPYWIKKCDKVVEI